MSNTSKEQPNIKNIESEADLMEIIKSQEFGDNHQEIQENYKALLGEELYKFYFGDENAKDISNLLSDCVSKENWNTLLEKHKTGKIATEDLIDVVRLSHLHAVEGANPISSPEEIIDRAFDAKIKGKLGRKLISSTIKTLSDAQLLTAPKEAVQAFLTHNINKADERATDVKYLPQIKEEKELKDASENAYNEFLNSFNVSDHIRDISLDELLQRLSDENDPYFGITHHIIFDMGWEAVSRHKMHEKRLSLYVCELDKAWTDKMESNLKESDRHITRYIITDIKPRESDKIDQVKRAIIKKYKTRFEEKIVFFETIWEKDNV